MDTLGSLGRMGVFLASLGIAIYLATYIYLETAPSAKAYISDSVMETVRVVESRYDQYINIDISGTELMELAYANKDNFISIIIFPAKNKGQRSVYWGYPIEGYYTDRIATAFTLDSREGCYIGNIRPRDKYSKPIIDLPSFNYPGSDFYIPANSLYKVTVIKDDEGYFSGFVCQEYGIWNDEEFYMTYLD